MQRLRPPIDSLCAAVAHVQVVRELKVLDGTPSYHCVAAFVLPLLSHFITGLLQCCLCTGLLRPLPCVQML